MTTTRIAPATSAVGRVVSSMLGHPMDETIMFDVNHFTFRTTRNWVAWTIERVDFDLVRSCMRVASVRIVHNADDRDYPQCKTFVVIDAGGTVLDDASDLAAALASAVTSVMFEPMIPCKI